MSGSAPKFVCLALLVALNFSGAHADETPQSTGGTDEVPAMPPPTTADMTLPPMPPAPPPQGEYTDISCLSCEHPWYPLESYYAVVGGTVELLVTSDAHGSVIDVAVQKTSRSRDLDRAAIAKAKTWRFNPGTVNGQPVGGTVMVPVDFQAVVPTAPTVYEGEQKIPIFPANKAKPIKWGDGPAVDDITSVSQAHEFLENACAQDVIETGYGFQIYLQFGASGTSNWTIFDARSGVGPSVVRRRYTTDDAGPVLKTSYVCEGDQTSCDALRAQLAKSFSRPVVMPARGPGKPWFSKCDPR